MTPNPSARSTKSARPPAKPLEPRRTVQPVDPTRAAKPVEPTPAAKRREPAGPAKGARPTRPREPLPPVKPARTLEPAGSLDSMWPWVLVALFLFIFFFHLRHLSDIPRGLYVDESSIGLNAASIAATGHDEHGVFLPVFFKAFGEWKNPLYIYLAALVFKVLGISELTLRLTSFVFFALFLLGLYLLLRDLFDGDKILILYGLLAAGFLPWFFLISRIAFEAVSQLTVTVFALLFTYRTFHGEQTGRSWLPPLLSGLFFGLSIYSYSTARLMTFLTIPLMIAIYFGRRYMVRHAIILAGFGPALVPYLIFSFRHPGALTHRFTGISYLSKSTLTVGEKAQQFLANYFLYFSPRYLFFAGDSQPRHHTGHGGEIYFTVGLLALIGLVLLLDRDYIRKNRWFVFLLASLVISPIAAALTPGDSSLRTILVGLFLLVLSVLGLAVLRRTRGAMVRTVLVLSVFVALSIEIVGYTRDYFEIYPRKSVLAFESYDFRTALAAAIAQRPKEIVVSRRANKPYAHLGFYRQMVANPENIPITVGEPNAQAGRCIIYFPFDQTIVGEQDVLVRQIDLGPTFTRLRCYAPR